VGDRAVRHAQAYSLGCAEHTLVKSIASPAPMIERCGDTRG
jgi:hypothetical protein